MKLIIILNYSFLLLLAGAPAHADNQEAGRNKSLACVACHGAEGVSDHMNWPDLAGQQRGYLVKQLKDFRSGVRHDPWMSPRARGLSDQDIDDLAGYFSTLKRSSQAGSTTVAKAKTATCVACHGANGISNNTLWPSLAGQKQLYLQKQLELYRDGVRNDPLMSSMVKQLSDQEIKTLAEFYSGL